ncbi:glycosyltransferase [Afipia massiliensis]|uniref:Glycosyltransferase n=1 Tax=Afipia massiliensis TaxID=211460 RepID=A0A4U6BUS2_9BRAD|nr:glycosyltransferase [Afipia massiliensis]TKT72918.1 glycosyltransferase [Afipia massiliensis]
MRILHAYKVYLPGVYGGIPSVIAMLTMLPRMGFQTEVLVACDRGMGRKYEFDGVNVEAVSSIGTVMSTPLAPSYPFRFAERARSSDIVVHHAPFPLTDLGVLLMPKDSVLIVHWHAEVIGRPWLMRVLAPFIRNSLKRADKIIVSDRVIVENSPFLKTFEDKCVVVPYGCDDAYWGELNHAEQRAVDNLQRQYPRLVVAVGRLVSYKGYEIFLRAMQNVDTDAVIIGEGPLKADLIRLSEELGVLDRVKFLGVLKSHEVKQYVHAAKALAFPSVTEAEAFGIVQLEAMSAGKPVVNTALATAVPQVARDGKEGLTVPPNQPAAFAEALRRLLDQPDFAARLGRSGKERVRTEFSKTLFLSRMQEIYQEAHHRRRSAQ